jgi:RNA polymerase sigma factor (sigma-70 family)
MSRMVTAPQSPVLAAGLSDDHLLRQIWRADQAAFEELYDRYGTDLFNYLVYLTGDQAVAEELLQETWLAVWQQAGSFRGEAQVKTWLLRIAHNQAISWRRRHRPDCCLTEVEAQPAPHNTEEAALRQIEDDQLLALLAYLSPDHRAVIELVFFHQLKYEEVAHVLDCPVGTVKSRIAHARRQLRAHTDFRLGRHSAIE